MIQFIVKTIITKNAYSKYQIIYILINGLYDIKIILYKVIMKLVIGFINQL